MVKKLSLIKILTGFGILFILGSFIAPAIMRTNCQIREPHVFIFNKTDEAYTFILYSKSEEVELVSTVIDPGESEYFIEGLDEEIEWDTYLQGVVFIAKNNKQKFTLTPEFGDKVPSTVSLTTSGLTVTQHQKQDEIVRLF